MDHDILNFLFWLIVLGVILAFGMGILQAINAFMRIWHDVMSRIPMAGCIFQIAGAVLVLIFGFMFLTMAFDPNGGNLMSHAWDTLLSLINNIALEFIVLVGVIVAFVMIHLSGKNKGNVTNIYTGLPPGRTNWPDLIEGRVNRPKIRGSSSLDQRLIDPSKIRVLDREDE